MAKHWEDLGDGKWKLTLSPDEGGPASVYYGSRDEIYDKVADSQVHAIRRIEQLRTAAPLNGNGHDSPPPSIQPKPLTPDERMQTVADLTNPATVDRGVTRVIESVIGPVSQFTQDREEKLGLAAAEQFAEETPEYYKCQHNANVLYGYMLTQNYDITRADHWKRAYAELVSAPVKLLAPKPTESSTETEPSAELQERNAQNLPPPMAPARYSTGIRSQDVSGTAPMPSKRLKWTREQIQNMSASNYRRNMMDPEFQRAVEFYSKPTRRMQATA